MRPLMRSCGPRRGMSRTVCDTSTTVSPLSTPSLKSSKKRIFMNSLRLLLQPVERDDVVARDLLLDALGQHAQVLLDVPARLRPDAVGMRIVRAPDDVVLADQRDDRL